MITIVGATGFTGTLTAKRLEQEQLPMRLAARSQSKLNKLKTELKRDHETVVADVTDLNQLKTAIAGSSVVINCAGPFTTLGLQVVEECIKSGIHYLDITGEQQFIREVIESFGQKALKNNVTVIPSCAFEYALGDAVADTMRRELGNLENFEATYIIDGMFTSRGTKRSVLCALEAAAHQLRNGKVETIRPGEISTFVHPNGKTYQRFPFPAGEVYLVPLHTPVKNISTYLASDAPPAVLNLLSTTMPVAARSPFFRRILNFAIDVSEPAPKKSGDTFFNIFCEGSSKRGKMRINLQGRDPYSLTAVIAARFAAKLCAENDLRRGVISASMIDKHQFIQSVLGAEAVGWTTVEKV
jgi:putative NADH-flavin reductase